MDPPPTTDTAGMNPERASMLKSIAAGGQDMWLESVTCQDAKVGPVVSGANKAGVAKRSNPNDHGAPKANSRTKSRKRSRSKVEADDGDALLTCHGASDFPPPPPVDCDSAYLASLLHYRTLQLEWEPKQKLKALPPLEKHACRVTDVGLVINDMMRKNSNVPVLDLPLRSALGSGTASVTLDGSIQKVVSGVLLEHVWHTMSSMSKRNISFQLGKIVKQMRKTPQRPQAVNGELRLGSVFAGKYSLLLDKHLENTNWAIRPRPSQSQFVAFLISSFHGSVPSTVATSIASQFKRMVPLTLCHGELSPRNIVVEGNTVIRILGWDCAGWYPEWWEYVKFFEARTSALNQDWYEYSKYIFETPFNDELAAFQAVARCQAP